MESAHRAARRTRGFWEWVYTLSFGVVAHRAVIMTRPAYGLRSHAALIAREHADDDGISVDECVVIPSPLGRLYETGHRAGQ